MWHLWLDGALSYGSAVTASPTHLIVDSGSFLRFLAAVNTQGHMSVWPGVELLGHMLISLLWFGALVIPSFDCLLRLPWAIPPSLATLSSHLPTPWYHVPRPCLSLPLVSGALHPPFPALFFPLVFINIRVFAVYLSLMLASCCWRARS